jgi:hypothetical protein
VRLECTTCGAAVSVQAPPYPVRLRHACDLIEPGRGSWQTLPEDTPPVTGDPV